MSLWLFLPFFIDLISSILIGTLIGTGEKVGISFQQQVITSRSKALDRALYSDLVGTSIDAIVGGLQKRYNLR